MRLPRIRLGLLALGILVGGAVGAVVGGSLHRQHELRAARASRASTPSPSPLPAVTVTRSTAAPGPSGPSPTRPRARTPRAKRRLGACPGRALRGVYHSSRLTVLDECTSVRGVVSSVRHEEDGDFHVDVLPDPGFDRLINEGNRTDQHGALVTEIMPGQPLPIPEVGERVVVFGTWVLDTQHGWNEIHPIWAVAYLDRGTLRRRLPPATPLFEPDGGGGGATLPPTSGAGSCTPGYSPCLPLGPSDYDCAGGSGNGPAYTRPGVVYRVKGSDPYDLDSDADGFGCES